MYASVLISYNVKVLDKTFDYRVPEVFCDVIRVGQKVLVPFGNRNVEGFILGISSNKIEGTVYKDIISICNKEFYLSNELLEVGKFISKKYICNLIGCYQMMLPSLLKASAKSKCGKKYIKYAVLSNMDYIKYISEHKRRKREIEIINLICENKEVKKSEVSGKSLDNLISLGIVVVEDREVNREVFFNSESAKDIVLNKDQKDAVNNIISSDYDKFLLHGVTGSGKTEVYINLIKYYFSIGKDCILLVPEISLTPQIVSRFKCEFGQWVACLHSSLSEGERYDEYRRIFCGKVRIVIGARSAVFAPLSNIGIIIVDECSSSSYKQDNSPKYSAIEVAFRRCAYNNAKCVLGSATPSLEQYARGLKGVYKLINLSSRVNNCLPDIRVVDMKKEYSKRNYIFSDALKVAINKRLSNKEQVLLLLNRRGYSTFISCRFCGFTFKCPSCDVTLTYHKSSNMLRCHYCGYSTNNTIKCPKCGEDSLTDRGLGIQKVEEELLNTFNGCRVLRMDNDTTSKKGSYEKILKDFSDHKYDILLGTQMISKGLNFDRVTLVGVINADASLMIPEFRSSEKAFELLMQTSGRSGRYNRKGEVILQASCCSNYVYKYAVNSDYVGFYNHEMSIRKALKYPPYYYLVYIKIRSTIYNEARDRSNEVKNYLKENLSNRFIVLGPSTARVFKLKDMYNFGILIKYKQDENIYEVLRKLNKSFISKKVFIDIDIDPINMK
ncbi:MAG: primosomal protein N' [Bacilli bacterium]